MIGTLVRNETDIGAQAFFATEVRSKVVGFSPGIFIGTTRHLLLVHHVVICFSGSLSSFLVVR